MCATLLLSLLAVAVPIKPPPDKPSGPPPTFRTVEAQREGPPVILFYRLEHRGVWRELELHIGGFQTTLTIKFTEALQVPYHVVGYVVDGEKFQVYRANGKRADPKDIKGMFKGLTPVLMSTDGKPVDPYYLQVVKDDAIILVGPPEDGEPND